MKSLVKRMLELLPMLKNYEVCTIISDFSGSNSYSLFKYASNNNERTHLEILETFNISKYRLVSRILRCKVVVSTHGLVVKPRGGRYIELWHGVPMKALGLLDKSSPLNIKKAFRKNFMLADKIISYSPFYTTLMNACIGVNFEKFVITGAPRNDFLLLSSGVEKLRKLMDRSIGKSKIVFFLPTFRRGFLNRTEGIAVENSIFGIGENLNELSIFLEQNDILLIFKPHPMEGKLIEKIPKSDRIIFIRNSDLEKNRIDLYELLNAADLLITDYSSVYFDFLLLNRPIIFIPRDLDEYRKTRGLLLEPYELWTPGPKVLNQKDLFKEILKSLSNPDYYADERERIRNIVHYYQDANSSKRVWEIVEYYLKG